MDILSNGLFSSVVLSHLMVDWLNGSLGMLLAYLSVPLGLTNTLVGLVSTGYMLSGSLTQPVTGYLSDRYGPRWLLAGGLFWTAVFFALAVSIHGPISLFLLVIASLGSGAVHPSGSAQATLIGRTRLAGKETTTASYFFAAGQGGYFFGPLIGGPLLDLWGPAGLLLPISLCLPVSFFAGWKLRQAVRQVKSPVTKDQSDQTGSPRVKANKKLIVILIMVALSQSWLAQNFSTFIPKYLSDLGKSAGTYGLIMAIYMAGNALGTILGGNIGDRFGRRGVIIAALCLASLPMFIISWIGFSPWLYPLVLLSGMCCGAAYTPIFISSQKLIPGGTGLVAGLTMAFMFSSGSVGALISGYLADAAGFGVVFRITSAIALLGGLLAIGLTRDQPSQQPRPELALE